MQRIPSAPPKIKTLPGDIERPLWSVMIPAFNCSKYLPEAIESVLQQDPGPDKMQIEVIDDCSTDENVEALVLKIGKGRVGYFRQECNVGSLRNFETCINRARGRYIHLLHGDDRIKYGYYRKMESLFDRFPNAGAAFCAWSYIDKNGDLSKYSRIEANRDCILKNWLDELAVGVRLQYVTITVKREVYEHLGAFYGVTYGEDWEMWSRIAKHYPTAYTPDFLAEYREHNTSISSQSFLTGKNIQDITKVINTISSYVPPRKQLKVNRIARRNYIYWATDEAHKQWHFSRNSKMVKSQLKEITNTYLDFPLFIKLSKLMVKVQLYSVVSKLQSIL
ncbi:glycosyltransferase family 2 protein [Desertivirga brevis]|uniref:glycosyltransferase family 2 protein n=1 Tax=Desertivirga brevis TaxID=2810310 RepID=UPI001A96AA7F|nr:glycosyltransferase [Pedobacter sp. SYSU D00873]